MTRQYSNVTWQDKSNSRQDHHVMEWQQSHIAWHDNQILNIIMKMTWHGQLYSTWHEKSDWKHGNEMTWYYITHMWNDMENQIKFKIW